MTVLNPPVAVQTRTDTNADDFRGALLAGMTAASAGSLLPRAGVLSGWGGELAVSQRAAGANMSVDVAAGKAVVPAPTAGHGGWYVINDALLNLTIAAAHATLARTDLIIARVADPQYHVGGDGAASVKVVTGTAGGGVPSVPVADGAYVVIAQVAVAAAVASIVNANITLNTDATVPRAVGLGGVLPVANAAARPSTPYRGQYIYQLDVNLPFFWNGTSWMQVVGASTTETLTNKTLSSPGLTGTMTGAGQISLSGQIITTSQLGLVNGAREIIIGYGGSGGISIGNNGGATHPNGMVLWANASNLFCRKPSGADVTIA